MQVGIENTMTHSSIRGYLSSINYHHFDYRPDSGHGVIKLIFPSRVQTRHVASLPAPKNDNSSIKIDFENTLSDYTLTFTCNQLIISALTTSGTSSWGQ